MLKIWPQVQAMTWSEKVMLHIDRFVLYRQLELICCVFIALASLYRKLLPKNYWNLLTFHDLKCLSQHDKGSLVAIFRFRVSSLPVTRCLRVFCFFVLAQKRRFSFFSHWLIMRSQNWPDLRSPISKFWDINFIDTVVCSNRWKFQGNRSVGVALTNIQTFYGVRSLDVTWWPDLA